MEKTQNKMGFLKETALEITIKSKENEKKTLIQMFKCLKNKHKKEPI